MATAGHIGGNNAQHPSDPAPSFNRHYDLGPIVWH
jgi:hypothetical protein